MIRTHIVTTAFVAAVMVPLSAQAEPQRAVQEVMHYMDITATCFDAAQERDDVAACVGQGATICMDTEDSGYSTIGMMFCTLGEAEAWDRLLNRDYATAMAGMRRMDAQEAVNFPEFAVRADSLRDAQRAWIPLRDAQCSLEYAMWGAGSMRQIAGASCKMNMTAERVIYLRFLGDAMR